MQIITKILLFVAYSCIQLYSLPDGYYDDSRRGYYFYEIHPSPQAQKRKDQLPYIPRDLSSLTADEFQALLENVKKVAVMHPTKRNVESYIKLQNYSMNQSVVFEKKYKSIILADPSLNIAVNNANGTYGRTIIDPEEEAHRKQFYDKHNEELGFIVFLNDETSTRTKKTKALFDRIQRKYGLVYKIAYTQTSQGLAAAKNVKTVPDVFLVYKTANSGAIWNRVATGIVTEDDILENTDFIIQTKLKGYMKW